VIAAFLYLRLVMTMWARTDADGEPVEGPVVTVPFAARLALVVCFVVTLAIGSTPEPLVEWSEDSTPELVKVPVPATDTAGLDPSGLEGLGLTPEQLIPPSSHWLQRRTRGLPRADDSSQRRVMSRSGVPAHGG